MDPAVPLIYSRESLPPPPGFWTRALAGMLAALCMSFLIIGAWLTPGSAGYGTHQQLGLDRCQFEARTGLPCPSCGFTTSVTYFVHGNWLASFYLQPMGFVIALFFCATVWIGFYIAFTGRPVYRLFSRLPGRVWLMALLFFAVGGWAWKIFIHVTHQDHWPP